MKLTKKERVQEILSLKQFGLLPEEIEAYFEFFDEVDEKKAKRVFVLNSKSKDAGEKRD